MYIEPCEAADYESISRTLSGFDYLAVGTDDFSRLVLRGGFTLFADGYVLACGGITDNWGERAPNRVGTAWLMMSDEDRFLAAGSTRVVRMIKHQLYDLVIDCGYNLVEANVSRYDLQAQKFVEHLGFRFCGLREHFGPSGEDFILYGLRGDHDRIRNRRRRRGCSGGAHQRPVGSAIIEGASGSGSF